MSFGTYARRVRDEQLPPAARHAALRCAVEHYCPLGFHATWAYLAATACPAPDLRRDTSALLRALDVLEASRSVWLEDTEAFASRRRTEKAAGRRSPRPADLARVCFFLPRWPGRTAPSRLGLVAAVASRHQRFRAWPLPDDPRSDDSQAPQLAAAHNVIDDCAALYLARLGSLDGAELSALRTTMRTLRQAVRPGYSPLNDYVHLQLKFANLLDYAARA